MTHEVETLDARSAISQMQSTVLRELSDLHRDKRDRDEVITNQQQQIKIMRVNVEVAKENEARAIRNAKATIMFMFFAVATSFISLGWTVWNSW